MMVWISGRFPKERSAYPSSSPSTTRTRPESSRALSAASAALVLGISKVHWSIRATRPSDARSDRAERSASWIIFFGVFWA